MHVRWSWLSTNGSFNWSMLSTSQCKCGSSLMAQYSWTKACGLSDKCNNDRRLRHCCRASPCVCNVCKSSSPTTPSWNRKSIMLAALRLRTTVVCSFWNLSFNTAFDSATVLNELFVHVTNNKAIIHIRLCHWYAIHYEYLLIFIIKQNLVGTDVVVLAIKLSYRHL